MCLQIYTKDRALIQKIAQLKKKPVTTMLTYPWKCTVLHCNHLGNNWKPLVLMTRHFDYCLSASEGDNQSVRSSAPVVSRCFPCGYNVKLYISRNRLAWWLLAFLYSEGSSAWPRMITFSNEVTIATNITLSLQHFQLFLWKEPDRLPKLSYIEVFWQLVSRIFLISVE